MISLLRRYLTLSVLLTQAAVFAADPMITVQVVNLSRTNALLVRFRNTTSDYPQGEGICFYRGTRMVACGHVNFSDSNGVSVQLTHGTNKFKPNESMKMQATPNYAKSDLRGYESFNLEAGGAFIGPSGFYIYPFLHFHFTVSKNIALGVQGYFTTPDSGNIKIYGGFLTGQYFFGKIWRDFYIGAGLGMTSFKGTSNVGANGAVLPTAVEDSISAISFKGVAGYRYIVADTFHIGAAAGFQFLSKTRGDLLDFGVAALSPEIELEFGYLF